MSSQEALKAAQLHGEVAAPFINSDCAITVHKLGHGIWWWDVDRVSAIAGPNWSYQNSSAVPEGLLQPRGGAPRIVRLLDGFEAQFWSDGCLLASTWRRQEFDIEKWREFLQHAASREDVAAAPLPVATSFSLNLNQARTAVGNSSGPWGQVERAGIALACASLLVASALGGRAFGMEHLADTRLTNVVPNASQASTSSNAGSRTAAQLTEEVLKLIAEPDAITATAELHRLLARRDVAILDFSVEGGMVDVQVRPPAEVSLQAIASDLEDSPLLAGVTPEFDNRTGLGRITATVCLSNGSREADMACLRRRAAP